VEQAKKFLDLFLLLSAPDGTERSESPLVVSLLGEVAEVLSPARRQKFHESILKKCHEHLHSPSGAMTTALLQLLVFKMPADCRSRVDSVRRLCLLVTECCSTEQHLDDDDEESDDDNRVERDLTTYTLVTKQTAAIAITTLVGMLDKMCGEMDLLLKLSTKSAKVSRASASSLRLAAASSSSSSSFTSADATMSDLWGGDVMDTCPANDVGEGEAVGWHVNDQICRSLRTCMDIAVHFLSFKSPGAVCHSVLALFLKLTKLQVKLTKLVAASSAAERAHVTTSPQYQSFRDLSLNMSTSVSQSLNRYVTEVHNLLGGPGGGARKGSSAQSSGGKAVHTKLSRLIPELIFQTEEIDLNVIKLMTGLKERDKVRTRMVS
jgi:hypothetical protein